MKSMLISVITPTYNRPFQIEKCLDALLQQQCDKAWEVIVVDDGGKNDLQPIITPFEDRMNITLVKQENKGPAAARNLGVQYASGEFAVFLDDDCEPDINWLTELSKQMQPRVMIGGRTENKLTNNLYAVTSQKMVSYLYEYFENTPWYFFTSNNFLVDRKTFLEIRGFDESFTTSAGEDREFCVRWTHQGNKMSYCSNAIIWHSHKMDFVDFWKLHFKYGQAAFGFVRKINQLGVESLKPNLRFYLDLLRLGWGQISKNFVQRFQLTFLLVISQFATLVGFLWNNK